MHSSPQQTGETYTGSGRQGYDERGSSYMMTGPVDLQGARYYVHADSFDATMNFCMVFLASAFDCLRDLAGEQGLRLC